MGDHPLDVLPLWAFFAGTLLTALLSVEGGYRLGRHRRERSELEMEAPVGEMVAATLGLLAFILAFTFSLAAQRFDARRQVLLDEANAIGTTYLRAGMLPDRRDDIRELLRTYVDVRLEAVRTGHVTEGIHRSEDIQNQLWAHAVAIAEQNSNSIIVGLFVQSLNEVIDLHAKRKTAATRNRIPIEIWTVLFAVAILALGATGYHGGLMKTSRSLAIGALALAFTVVIGLISDLDRPLEGFMSISQQALIDVRASMH